MFDTPIGHIEFENKVMDMLLFGDNPILDKLREQYQNSTVEKRRFTGVGFFTDFLVSNSIAPLSGIDGLVFGDVYADFAGIQGNLGFMIFIEKGYLSLLEGFNTIYDWPKDVSNIELYYIDNNTHNPKRRDNRDLIGLIQEFNKTTS